MENNPIGKIIRSKRRTLGLEITREAILIVRAPLRASIKDIEEIVRQKRSWIERHQRRIRETAPSAGSRSFDEGSVFLFLGAEYPLRVVRGKPSRFFFDGSAFVISETHLPLARSHFERWYRRQAAETIRGRVGHYAALSGLAPSGIKINGAEKRWGSCGPSNSLNFTWRLVMAPLAVLDYVVVHELAHIAEKNHSKKFWARVERLMPDYRAHRAWLRGNESALSW